jgi:hypothetical protein
MPETGALATASGPSSRPVAGPVLSPHAHRRSRLVSKPLKAIRRDNAEGRYVNDLAARWLKLVDGDPADPLVIAAVVAAAELSWRADQARRDPLTDIALLVRLENAVVRRLRVLGIVKPRGRNSRIF